MTVLRVIPFLFLLLEVSSIWPPPHEIKLEDGETFIISELSESDDLFSDEDEMIPVKPSPPEGKYFRIHQIALHHNKRELSTKKSVVNITKFREHNFDLDEAIPWEGGFVDRDGNFIQPENENVYYLNEMAKSLIESKIKRKREDEEGKVEEKVENYDYGSFKAEYQKEVGEAKKSNKTFNYTDVKEDESVGEAVGAMVDFKDAKNCSSEESKGIGVAAIKCLVTKLQTSKSQNSTIKLLEKILRIGLIWFCVYVCIAIPCWCQRGWCCCCCCCKICRPRETIDEAKQFFTQNPPGVLNTQDERIEYPPTTYEIYTQNRLEKALFSL